MERKLTCIVCPMGCEMQVLYEENRLLSVSGNTCPRGRNYAEKEIVCPERTLTTTVRSVDGRVVSVKTDRPISKSKIFECMRIINNCNPSLPIFIGDVIIKDVFGANVIATSNLK